MTGARPAAHSRFRLPGRPLIRTGHRRREMIGRLVKAALIAVVLAAIVRVAS